MPEINLERKKTPAWARVLPSAFRLLLFAFGLFPVPCSLFPLLAAPPSSPPPPSRVVRAVDPRAVHLLATDSKRVLQLFDAALEKFANASSNSSAWQKLGLVSSGRVGLKIYTSSGEGMATHPDLIEAVIASLEEAGVPRSRIVVFDQYAAAMEDAGFKIGKRSDGVTFTASIPIAGYDSKDPLDLGIAGKLIWGDLDFIEKASNSDDQPSTLSHFSKIITQEVDQFIDLPVIVTDPDYGLIGCQLNSSVFLVDNNRRFRSWGATRDESIAGMMASPVIKKKCLLHVLDGLVAQYAGGPDFNADFSVPLQTLFISHDPVALDTLAVQWINEQRPKHELEPLKEQVAYLHEAALEKLGTDIPSKMEIVDVNLGK